MTLRIDHGRLIWEGQARGVRVHAKASPWFHRTVTCNDYHLNKGSLIKFLNNNYNASLEKESLCHKIFGCGSAGEDDDRVQRTWTEYLETLPNEESPAQKINMQAWSSSGEQPELNRIADAYPAYERFQGDVITPNYAGKGFDVHCWDRVTVHAVQELRKMQGGLSKKVIDVTIKHIQDIGLHEMTPQAKRVWNNLCSKRNEEQRFYLQEVFEGDPIPDCTVTIGEFIARVWLFVLVQENQSSAYYDFLRGLDEGANGMNGTLSCEQGLMGFIVRAVMINRLESIADREEVSMQEWAQRFFLHSEEGGRRREAVQEDGFLLQSMNQELCNYARQHGLNEQQFIDAVSSWISKI